MGALQHYAGRIPESEIAFTQALEALRRTSSTLTLSLASACANVSRILQNSDPTEAESLARESERIQQFYNDSERCPETAARAVGDLAQLHAAHGRTIEAEALYRKSIGLKRSLKGSRPLSLAITLDNYQVFLRKQGRIAEALTLASEALGLARSMAKVEHSFLASVLNNFAALQIERKEFADARMLLNEALLIRRAETPRDSRRLAILLSSIAALNVAEEDLPEAKAFFEEAISVLEKSGLPAHEMLMQLRQNVEEIRKEQVNHLI